MKHWMQLSILLLAVLLALAVPAMAYEIPEDFTGTTLEEVMSEFMNAYKLNTQNFSVSYTNTVTGETYTFNDEKFMVAGSTYKLPLNMYYYEMEREGLIEPDAIVSRIGVPLNEAHYKSLVLSDNDVSIGMLYNLGEFDDYKIAMRKYFTMEDSEIDSMYYVDNYYCTRMMMDALSYLYEYRADFEEMINYMKEAQPGQYFKSGVTEYEVAHKYGMFEGALNDVGIIYAPQPFLLAVYTQDVDEWVLVETAALFTAYNEWQNPPEPEKSNTQELEVQYVTVDGIQTETGLEEETPEKKPAKEPEAPVVQNEAAEEPAAFEWWMVAVALGVFLLGGGIVLQVANPKRLRKRLAEEPDAWDEEEET